MNVPLLTCLLIRQRLYRPFMDLVFSGVVSVLLFFYIDLLYDLFNQLTAYGKLADRRYKLEPVKKDYIPFLFSILFDLHRFHTQ